MHGRRMRVPSGSQGRAGACMARGPAQCVRTAARTGDHRRYQKERADETILRTKVPHGSRDEIGDDLSRHILRDQLRVTEEQFWAIVRGGDTLPDTPRAVAATVPA